MPKEKPYIAGIARTQDSVVGAQRRRKAGMNGVHIGMPVAETPDYVAGDRVSHVKYGDGTVQAISREEKDYKVTVDFDEVGRKIMYAAFAKLKKL